MLQLPGGLGIVEPEVELGRIPTSDRVVYSHIERYYGRLDFLLTESGDAYCLEANTLPGLTPTSLLPQEAAAVGIDYPTLCKTIIKLSLEKTNG